MNLVNDNKVYTRICKAFDEFNIPGDSKFPQRGKLHPFMHYDPKDKLKTSWGYISRSIFIEYSIRAAMLAFKQVNGRPAKTFLDLGSGKGGVLFVATLLKLQAEGVEYSKELIDICKEIIGLNKIKGLDSIIVHKGNIQTWIPPKDYDIVYYYRPISQQKAWRKFENHFINTYPNGQVVISLGHEQEQFFKPFNLPKLDYQPVYQKIH